MAVLIAIDTWTTGGMVPSGGIPLEVRNVGLGHWGLVLDSDQERAERQEREREEESERHERKRKEERELADRERKEEREQADRRRKEERERRDRERRGK